MIFVSLTRLRIRSFRFVPLFFLHTIGSLRQVKRSPGFEQGALLADRKWAFWTLTAWEDEQSMRQYMINGSHKKAMPHLMHWCDEASVAHWLQADATLPTWTEADRRMREAGRPSKVKYPSARHASLGYDSPRVTSYGPIRKAGPGSQTG